MSGNNNTITAADAIITLTVNNLYPSGVQLQGFAADNVYGTDPLVLAETVRGIDGKLSAGFVYSNIIQTFHIMPDSPSRDIFDTWSTTSRTSRAVFRCNAVVLLPAIGRKYTCVNGVLKQCTRCLTRRVHCSQDRRLSSGKLSLRRFLTDGP